MTIRELVTRNRSYRRFHQDVPVDMETLRDLVDLARLSPSAGNLQPLKFMLCCDPKNNNAVFGHLKWAAYLADWPGPPEGERPTAYIVILGDRDLAESINCDHGIAAQSILLGAAEKGLGGCILASIGKTGLRKAFDIPERFDILLVLALGKPKETVVLESMGPDGNIRYWRDEQGVHHVPKRSLDEIIIMGP
jgi:nitroreductase